MRTVQEQASILPDLAQAKLPNNNICQSVVFPEISFNEFKSLPYSIQKSLIARNRIINTDTYNRTMCELTSQLSIAQTETDDQISKTTHEKTAATSDATYTLQMRRSPFNYLVACGLADLVEELTFLPISKAELEFAVEYYKHTNVPFFNEQMWRQIVESNHGQLPLEIRAVKDGTLLIPGEPLMTVHGPEELIAHFEPLFHRVFYSTLVATRANVLAQIIGDPKRFIEVGKRGAITEEQHLQALKAMYIGGGFTLTSNDAGPAILPLKDVGTIAHRYVQRFESEEKAFRFAIDKLPAVTLLVDLVDTYQGIDLSLKLKEDYRATDKRIWVRLDSGDIMDQVRYFLNKTEQLGFTDPVKDCVVVEGIDGFADIRAIEQMITDEFGEEAKKRVLYGAGGLMISEQTSRSDASTGLKLAEYTDELGILQPTMKFSNSPGKISYPGSPHIVIADGRRVIAQEGEELSGNVYDLFEPYYVQGEIFCSADNAEFARQNVLRQERLMHWNELDSEQLLKLRAVPSVRTQEKIETLHSKYALLD